MRSHFNRILLVHVQYSLYLCAFLMKGNTMSASHRQAAKLTGFYFNTLKINSLLDF